ncbi:MAG: hypothetical protein ACRBN8_22640 [Nannocystales bacterium]
MPEYHLHGNELHDQADSVEVCREARRATIVAVGHITRSVRRLETTLKRLRRTPGPGHRSDRHSAPTEAPGFGTYCEGRR